MIFIQIEIVPVFNQYTLLGSIAKSTLFVHKCQMKIDRRFRGSIYPLFRYTCVGFPFSVLHIANKIVIIQVGLRSSTSIVGDKHPAGFSHIPYMRQDKEHVIMFNMHDG